MTKLCMQYAGGEDLDQHGRKWASKHHVLVPGVPLRMSGWVRARKSTRSDWFCPICTERWKRGTGDAAIWILIWEDAIDMSDAIVPPDPSEDEDEQIATATWAEALAAEVKVDAQPAMDESEVVVV
eukprot:5587977-Amphidinium_carterae.1